MRETVWQFDTARFSIIATVAPCEDDPADSFEDEEAINAIRAGEYEWFNVQITVYLDGVRIADDTLCACAYKTIAEFLNGHRDADPMNRNSSIMRQARGGNVVICHYFPDMVFEAVKMARENVKRLASVKLRA